MVKKVGNKDSKQLKTAPIKVCNDLKQQDGTDVFMLVIYCRCFW